MAHLTYLIYILLYESLVLGGTAYAVFVLGHSGWWFVLALILSAGACKPDQWIHGKKAEGDMWPFKKKPVVPIWADGAVSCSPEEVELLDLRAKTDSNHVAYVPPNFRTHPGQIAPMRVHDEIVFEAPDTIESLINRLIELGEPKPDVVINGEKWEGGKELYKATIDELHVLANTTSSAYGYSRTTYELGSYEHSSCKTRFYNTRCYNGFNTLADCEKAIISILKDRLARVVTETTTITY